MSLDIIMAAKNSHTHNNVIFWYLIKCYLEAELIVSKAELIVS